MQNNSYMWGILIVFASFIVFLIVVLNWALRSLRQKKSPDHEIIRRKRKLRIPTFHASPRTRWFWLLAALFYVSLGPYLLDKRETIFLTYDWLTQWNALFQFEFHNLNNAVTAVISMLLGGILFAWISQYSPLVEALPLPKWEPSFKTNQSKITRAVWLIAILLLVVMSVRLWQQDKSFLPVVLWLLALSLLSWNIWQSERNQDTDLSLHLAKSDWVWLLTLLIFGFAVGSAYLLEIPARMIGDEGSFWETARWIAEGENQVPFFGLGVYTFPIASSFLQAWVLRLFGMTIWSWRFASVIAGVLSAIPLYLLTKELFDRRTAVIATFVMLVSPYFLAFARLGYNNSQALFPVTLCLFFAVLSLKRNSSFYLWLTGLAAGLGFYTYSAAQLGLVVLILIAGYLWITRRFTLKNLASFLGIILVAWLLFRLPYFIFSATGVDQATPYKTWESMFMNVFYARSLFTDAEIFRLSEPISFGSQQVFFEPFLYARLLVRGVVQSLLVFNTAFGRIGEHFIETNLAGGVVTSTLLILGSALAIRGWRQLRFVLLLLWFGSGVFLLSAMNTFPPRHAHMVSIIPAMAILIAIGLVSFVDMLVKFTIPKLRENRALNLSTAVIIAALLVIGYAGMTNYFDKLAQKYPLSFEHVVAWTAVQMDQNTGTIVYVETEPIWHDVDYLLRAKALSLNYVNLATANVLDGTTSLPHSENLTVFIPIAEVSELLPIIETQIENSSPPILLEDSEGTQWGYAITNNDKLFTQNITIPGAFYSLVRTPAWTVLLGLTLLLWIGLGWSYKKNRRR